MLPRDLPSRRFTSVIVAGAVFAAGYAEVSPFRVDYSDYSDKPAISRPDFFTQVYGTTSSTGVVLDIRDYVFALSPMSYEVLVFPSVDDE